MILGGDAVMTPCRSGRRGPIVLIGSVCVVACALTGLVPGAGVRAAMPTMSDRIQVQKTVPPYRLVLVVLPAEPFYRSSEAAANAHAKMAMVAVGGAAPRILASVPRPNHHLIVHVYTASTGKAVQHARVAMRYQALTRAGAPAPTPPTVVPVVEMRIASGGAETTHYGNNVLMPPGRYRVTVTVNSVGPTSFDVSVH
ncbi:MAG TPA: hypothetical protein VEP50_02065, partial [bacterium]|nr:hypothetical protein [bacterium]